MGKAKKIIRNTIFTVVGVFIVLIIIGLFIGEEECKVSFRKIYENYTDSPIKGQLIVKYVVNVGDSKEKCSFKELAEKSKGFLQKEIDKYINKRFPSSQYHTKPTLLYMYVYENEKLAKDIKMWIAMAEWSSDIGKSFSEQDENLYKMIKENTNQ